MTTTRTDAHRPSSVEFDPEKYECAGVFDLNPEDGAFDHVARVAAVNQLLAQGYHFASHQNHGQCGHCGAALRYVALMAREDLHEMIYVGETCLSNRFESLTKAQFTALRKAAQLDREKHAKLAGFNLFLADHPEIVPATYVYNLVFDTEAGEFGHEKYGTGWATSVVADIMSKAHMYGGQISEKQIAFIVKLVAEIEEKVANYTPPTPAGDAPEGKASVEGEVLKKAWKDSAYGPGGDYKMTVKLDNGSFVWGTAPANIANSVERGSRVRFTATFTRKENDSTFAFFKRPTMASIV